MVDSFQAQLSRYLEAIKARISTTDGSWSIKGVINTTRTIYPISHDTKVLSKLLELLIVPILEQFAHDQNFLLRLPEAQNHYPDFTFINLTDAQQVYALDVKTTYRLGQDRDGRSRVNGMTLGTFGGYFRARTRTTGITLPYNSYLKHFVLGIIYNRASPENHRRSYSLHDLAGIPSVIYGFEIFLHEKYKIASDQPGSGNTKNIGSTKFLDRLLNGTGVFAQLGVDVFDDYWMHYRTRSMAQNEGHDQPPYTDLLSYRRYKLQGAQILSLPEEIFLTERDSLEADEGE